MVLLTNGIAIDHCSVLISIAEITPTIEMSATTASVVPSIVCRGKLEILLSAGLMINPPPTPNKPEKKPAINPANVSARKQGAFQTKRPEASLSRQGVENRSESDGFRAELI